MLLNVDSSLHSTAAAITRLAGLKRQERPPSVLWYEKRGIHLSEKVWRNQFRVSKTVFNHVLDQIAGHELFITQRAGRRAIDVGKQLAIFLFRVGSSHPGVHKIAEKFEVSASTVVHVTKRVALAIKDCFGHNVHLPTGGAEKKKMLKGFTKRQYEGAFVVIDGTGVEVVPSTATTRAGLRNVYKGKDKGLAIRFQVACDMDMRIRHIWGGNPAAVHDMDLFKSSPLYTRVKEYLSEQQFYIGDAGYTLRPYLMTPYSTAEMKKVEKFVANAWVFLPFRPCRRSSPAPRERCVARTHPRHPCSPSTRPISSARASSAARPRRERGRLDRRQLEGPAHSALAGDAHADEPCLPSVRAHGDREFAGLEASSR